MSAEPTSELSRSFNAPSSGDRDFATHEESLASHERAARRVKYTAEMLRIDAPYAVSFVTALVSHQDELSIDDVARLLHDHISPMSEVMSTIDDDTLDQRGRMIVHLSRLTSARGRTDQYRFATRRQQDRVLRGMDAAEATMHDVPYDRSVALIRLVNLRASLDWEREEHNQWFLRTHHRLAYEIDEAT